MPARAKLALCRTASPVTDWTAEVGPPVLADRELDPNAADVLTMPDPLRVVVAPSVALSKNDAPDVADDPSNAARMKPPPTGEPSPACATNCVKLKPSRGPPIIAGRFDTLAGSVKLLGCAYSRLTYLST